MQEQKWQHKWQHKALQGGIAAAVVVFLVAAATAGSTRRVEAAARQKMRIEVVYQPIGESGDYRLSIYGGRELVCEEQPLRLIEGKEPAVDPIIIECRHPGVK